MTPSVVAFRFFRICLKLNNRNLTNHLMKSDIMKPLIDLTVQESRRDNLLSSSCQEFFEHKYQENVKEFINYCMTKYEPEIRKLAGTPLGGPRFMAFIRRWEMNNEPPPKEEKIEKPDLRVPSQSRMVEVEEEDYFNRDDDDDFILPIAAPLIPRAQAPSPPLNLLKRKRRTGLNISPGFRPTLTPPRPPPIGSLVDYDDEDQDLGGTALADDIADSPGHDLKLPRRSPSQNLLSSPRLLNRQVSPSNPPQRPPPDDDEDNLLEALVRPRGPKDRSPSPSIATPKVPNIGMGPIRLSGKRRRDDDDDELERLLSSKTKRPDLGAEKILSGTSGRAGSKPGDDPPKKIKLKFGLTSLGAAPTSVPPSEAGAKDGDTG